MDVLWHPTTLLVSLHVAVTLAVGLRVVMTRPVPSVALAWLFLVVLLPGIGLAFYIGIGERRLGGRRAQRLAALRQPYMRRLQEIRHRPSARIDWSRLSDTCEPMNRLGVTMADIPTLNGNELQLLIGAEPALQSILEDVERARSTLHLQFYTWHPGGIADEVVDAVIRAARRGVVCGILVDALGSRDWLRSVHPERLRAAGVKVVEAMPTGPVRALFRRNDLRNHRKIVVADGDIAYTGSMNMVDPRFFKQGSVAGQLVDAMVRMRGPAVEAINGVLLSDWYLETMISIEDLALLCQVRMPGRRGPSVEARGQGHRSGGSRMNSRMTLLLRSPRAKSSMVRISVTDRRVAFSVGR